MQGPSHGDVFLTGQSRAMPSPKERTNEEVGWPCAGHETVKLGAQAREREPTAASSAPSPHPQGPCYRWVHSSHAWGLRAASLLGPPGCPSACMHMRVHVCIRGGGEGASERDCLQGNLSPTPTCCCSRREQDALTPVCISGVMKPQPLRQWCVHQG